MNNKNNLYFLIGFLGGMVIFTVFIAWYLYNMDAFGARDAVASEVEEIRTTLLPGGTLDIQEEVDPGETETKDEHPPDVVELSLDPPVDGTGEIFRAAPINGEAAVADERVEPDESEEPIGNFRLLGTFTDARGKPVEGATVTLRSEGGTLGNREIPRFRREAITDPEGHWDFTNLPVAPATLRGVHPSPPRGMMASVEQSIYIPGAGESEIHLKLPFRQDIRGTVVDMESGEGVEGVQVILASNLFGSRGMQGGLQPVNQADIRAAAGTASGPDGSFHLMVPMTLAGNMIVFTAPENYLIHATGSMYYGESLGLTLLPELVAEPLLIEAMRADSMRFRILHPDGETPVSGARVTTPGTNRTSDGEGLVSLPIVPSMSGNVTVESDFVIHTFPLDRSMIEPGKIRDIILPHGAGMAIQVLGAEDYPDRNITINIQPVDANGRRLAKHTHWTHTDENRRAVARKLEAGQDYLVSAFLNQSHGYIQPAGVVIVLEPDEFFDALEIEIRKGTPYEGTVTDHTGSPLPGATITGYRDTNDVDFARSDEEGNFHLGSFEGSHRYDRLTVSREGYKSVMFRGNEIPDSPATISMNPRLVIPFRVFGEDGVTPHHFFEAQLFRGGSSHPVSRMTMQHASDEPSRLYADDPGPHLLVVKSIPPPNQPAGAMLSGSIKVEVRESDQEEYRVVLGQMGVLRGMVVDGRTGEPIPNAQVHQVASSRTTMPSQSPGVIAISGTALLIVDTDEKGMFEIPGVAGGEIVVLRAHHEGYTTSGAVEFTVPGADEEDAIVRMELAPAFTLFGRFIGIDGSPIEGMVVRTSSQDMRAGIFSMDRTTTTDGDGRYEIVLPMAGPFWMTYSIEGVHFRVDEYIPTDRESQELERNFDYSEYTLLTGRIFFNGEPWNASAMTLVIRQDQEIRTVNADPEGDAGAYRMLLRPGPHLLTYTPTHQALATFYPMLVMEMPLEEFSVSSVPPRQERVFLVHHGMVDLGLVYPSGEDFQSGQLTLERLGVPGALRPRPMEARDEYMSLPIVPVGDYRLSFRSNDGEWRGTSEPFAMGMGDREMVLIDVNREAVTHLIGEWEPSILGIDHVPVDFDATVAIDRDGTALVSFVYRSGSQALTIERVDLLENGNPIATDIHDGWAGASHRDTIYSLSVVGHNPEAVYTVRAYIAAGVPHDSNGTVHLVMEEGR